MNKVVVGIIALSAVILVAGVVMVSTGQQQTPIDEQLASEETRLRASDHVKGPNQAPLTLIEFSDFQCPACASYHSVLKELTQEFQNEIQIVYRHFPIRSLHRHAELAARAAEAAGKQGKFWEMHDILFELQAEWAEEKNPQERFFEYAQSLDLDLDVFKTDLNSNQVSDKVNADNQSGLRLGVDATPTFYLNGKKIQNPGSYEEFKKLLQSNLNPGSE